MSVSRYLFGDFPVRFHTSLPASEAAGRLAAIADQSTFRRSRPELHGYATVNEVVLWEGSEIFVNPFRPYFHGSFLQQQDTTVLSGVIRADWKAKIWCAGVAIGGLIALLSSSTQLDGIRALGVAAVAAAAFILLHLSVRPGSRLSRSLSAKIETAIRLEG